MKERPILFSGEMVRAILDGRKTQTRRIVKPQPTQNVLGNLAFQKRNGEGCSNLDLASFVNCFSPYGQPGDRLWVKETFFPRLQNTAAVYRADIKDSAEAAGIGAMYGGWKPSIFMPRRLSRITLEITSVRVERVMDISREDVIAEGIPESELAHHGWHWKPYMLLWESINGKDSWAKNPWVWVIGFQRGSLLNTTLDNPNSCGKRHAT